MNTMLVVITILLFVLQSVSLKLSHAEHLADKLLVNGAFALIAGVGMCAAGLCSPALGSVSLPTLLWGILFGVLFALTILFYNLALGCGPLSYTAFYFSSSMLIPILAGLLFFGEKAGRTLLAAVLLFLTAFFFLNVAPRSETGKPRKAVNKKWIFLCVLTFCCNGALAVIQKCHQTAMEGRESGGLMLVGFLAAAVSYLAGWAVCRARNQRGAKWAKVKTSAVATLLKANWLPVLLLAAGSLGGNLLLTYLAGIMPSSYLFPLVQGSIIVGVTLVSMVVFRERLSKRGMLGILLGVCAIVLINL